MAITSRGRTWEILHSLWILWTFTIGLFSWVAFIYIGARTRQAKWVVAGVVYAVPLTLSILFSDNETLWYGWVSDLTGYLALGLGVISIVHAFRARKEYLLRLEAMQPGLARERSYQDAELREEIRDEYGLGGLEATPAQEPSQPVIVRDGPPREPVPPDGPSLPSRSARPFLTPTEGSVLIDINSASEAEISELPGVGAALAQWAIQLRSTRGGFHSLEDFGQSLGMDPDAVEVIRPLVVVGPAKGSVEP